MPINNEWDVDYTSLAFSHIDGDLVYDTGAGTVPDIDEVITGTTSGATAVVLTASDGSTAAAGTLILTDVLDGAAGPFLDNEALTGSSGLRVDVDGQLSVTKQAFLDYVSLTAPFSGSDIGAAVTGAASSATAEIVDVRLDSATEGRLYLLEVDGVFTDGEALTGSDGGLADAAGGSVHALVKYSDQTVNFTAGQVVTGKTSAAEATITSISDDEFNTTTRGYLYMGPVTGAFQDGEEIVDDAGTPGSASVDGLATFVQAQWPSNRAYSYLQDTFDELQQMDDTVPWSAQVKNQQYTSINAWTIPNLSTRYLKQGSIQTSSLNDIWTNYSTLGTIAGNPLLYLEQSGSVLTTFWDQGQIDVLVRNRSGGELINGGALTIFARKFGTLFDNFSTTALAGATPIPLATATDLNNVTSIDIVKDYDRVGIYFINQTLTQVSGAGSSPVESDVVWEDGSNNTTGYILSSSGDGDPGLLVLGNLSGTFTAHNPISLLSMLRFKEQSASFGAGTIIANADGGETASGSIRRIEQIGGAVGRVYLSDVWGTWSDEDPIFIGAARYATASGTLNLSGTWKASASSDVNEDTVARDVGDGNGFKPYDAIVECSGATLAQTYEYFKYVTRDESVDSVDTLEGRIYISANTSSYSPVKQSPLGTFAGGTLFGARGIFVQNMASADVRSYQLIDASGTVRNPPNLQTITVTSLEVGDRVAVFPRSGSTSEIFKDQYAINGALVTSGSTVVHVQETIQTETPSAGIVRLIDKSYNYQSLGTSSFNVGSGVEESYSDGDDVYVPYIETTAAGSEVSVNVVHVADRPIKTRVRIKGILPFEVDGTFGSAGATVAAIRTEDTIVDA